MSELKATFTLEKETKNCLRYQEETEGYPIVGSLYVQKGALNGTRPPKLEVTIKPLGVKKGGKA